MGENFYVNYWIRESTWSTAWTICAEDLARVPSSLFSSCPFGYGILAPATGRWNVDFDAWGWCLDEGWLICMLTSVTSWTIRHCIGLRLHPCSMQKTRWRALTISGFCFGTLNETETKQKGFSASAEKWPKWSLHYFLKTM